MAAARALTFLVIALAACERDTPRPPAVDSLPPAAPSEPPLVLNGNGIGCLRVGTPLAALGGECSILADRTVPGPEGMPERRADMLMGDDTVAATVVGDSVWRVEVTTPKLTTEDGLGVGTEAASLLARPGSRVIGGEGRLFITLDDHCGMSFELGAVPRDVLALPPDQAAGRIPAGTRIARILIFGCAGPA